MIIVIMINKKGMRFVRGERMGIWEEEIEEEGRDEYGIDIDEHARTSSTTTALVQRFLIVVRGFYAGCTFRDFYCCCFFFIYTDLAVRASPSQ